MPFSSTYPATGAAVRVYLSILAVMVVAVMLNAVIPPMQSPDEPAHLGRAYLLSKGQILLDSSPEGPGGYVDNGLIRFMDIFFDLGVRGKMDSTLVNGVVPFLHWENSSSHRAYTGTAYYFPAIYAPQALALAVAESLGLSIAHSYELARFAVFGTVAVLVVVAAGLVRPGPFALALLLTPMAVFQLISSTIDALSLALCMLSISCFLVLLKPERHKRDGLLFGTLCGAILILASSRAYAVPLLLLPIVVGWKRRSKALLAVGMLVALAAVGWTLFAVATTHDDRVQRALGTVGIMKYYGYHPAIFLQVLWSTLKAKAGFYMVSFLGQLGYLNVALPRSYYTAAAGTLVFLALISLKPRAVFEGENIGRATLALLAIPACFIIFLAMLATWTPFPSAVIEGVQGRYFHIPAMMLAYAVAGTQPWRHSLRNCVAGIALAGFVVMGASVALPALLDRYWVQDRAPEATNAPAEKVALTLREGSILTGSRLAQGDGNLYSVAFDLGTFYGRSNGELAVEVCTDECRRGVLDVSGAADNQLAYIALNQPLRVTDRSLIRYRLTMSSRFTHPLVVWGYQRSKSGIEVVLDGQKSSIEPNLKLAIR